MTPTYETILKAATAIKSVAVKTPLLESPALNEFLGCRLFVKAETLQKTGSFKFRGAFNAISSLSTDQKNRGIFAYSSGNHAQGVALAAQMHGIKATILMPEDTPEIKLNNTKGYGAKVITYNRYTQSREEIGAKIAAQENLTLIKPYDNPHVISGQGTTGIEIIQQLKRLNLEADAIVAPCGGGGLLSGISLAAQTLVPDTRIYAAEPENFDDTTRSLIAGKRLENGTEHKSICDAIVTPMPGELTFPILQSCKASGVTVSDEEAKQAIWAAFHYFKLVVEPGGAVAFAALLQRKIDVNGKVVVAVLSGGNVDQQLFASTLSQYSSL
ncbi:threonine ammonia-lyase [Sneathiella glossodoripedis]|uniref:threonine ammonia-lyase n=1 Tax=Sneathiella glossodoripedis TaxID=418853 RepID=UPI0004701A53|nr:threonine/serine dehydratase [Sneathiella glossodoripedis]